MNPKESPSKAWDRLRRAPLWLRGGLLLGALYLVWLLTAPAHTKAMRLSSVGFLGAFNFFVAWAFLRASRRDDLAVETRRALISVSAGMAMVGLGAVYMVSELAFIWDSQDTFSMGDAFFMLSYPLVIAGLFLLPRGERPVASRLRIVLDGAACVVGAGVPMWLGAIAPAWHGTSGVNAFLEVLWPCVSFAGLFAVNAALLTRAPHPTRGALWLLLTGIVVSWLADLVFSLDASTLVIRHSQIQWINATNIVSLCISLVAAWRFGNDPPVSGPTQRPVSFSPVPMATMMIVATWLIILSIATPSDPQMLRRILPGMVPLFFILFVREIFVLADTLHWLEVDFQRESHARVEAMVRHSSDVMMVVDAAGTVRYASPSVTAVLGLPVEPLVGRSLLELTHPDDVARGERFLSGLLRSEDAVDSLRWRLRHADGAFRQFESAGSNALGASEVGGLVINSRDVSERAVLEEQLRRSYKLEAIGRLVGGIAHNFNNILGGVLLRAGMIRENRHLPKQLDGDFADLEKGVMRTADLIRRLQAFSQVQFLRLKRLDLTRMMAELQPELRRFVSDRVRVIILYTDEPKWVDADGELVTQMILNLCANAREAMPDGGELKIDINRASLEESSGESNTIVREFFCLSFQDTGRGMDDRIQQRLFEPFFTTKEVGKGLGLGLAAVHGIVKQHRGQVTVESAVGRGTTFRVFLPVAPFQG